MSYGASHQTRKRRSPVSVIGARAGRRQHILQSKLSRQMRDLRFELTKSSVCGRNKPDEDENHEVEQQVSAPSDSEKVRDPGKNLREEHGRSCCDDKEEQKHPAHCQMPRSGSAKNEVPGDGDNHDGNDLKDDCHELPEQKFDEDID